MLRQGGILNSDCQYKYLESIGHIKQKRETGGRGRQELRELENKRRFKGKTEKNGEATEVERPRERKRVGGEKNDNRSRVSPLLYLTVALLPAGAIQRTLTNAHKQINACTCKRHHSASSSS